MVQNGSNTPEILGRFGFMFEDWVHRVYGSEVGPRDRKEEGLEAFDHPPYVHPRRRYDALALGFGFRREREARGRKQVTSPLPYTSKYTRLYRGV